MCHGGYQLEIFNAYADLNNALFPADDTVSLGDLYNTTVDEYGQMQAAHEVADFGGQTDTYIDYVGIVTGERFNSFPDVVRVAPLVCDPCAAFRDFSELA